MLQSIIKASNTDDELNRLKHFSLHFECFLLGFNFRKCKLLVRFQTTRVLRQKLY